MSATRGAWRRAAFPALLISALVLLPAYVTADTQPVSVSGAGASRVPGGPILVIAGEANPFSSYYGEILRTEGLNEFAVKDIADVTTATLASYDVAIVGDIDLTPAQVAMVSRWVWSGGDLIAMRPDAQLAGLLGLTFSGSSISEAYLKVDTQRAARRRHRREDDAVPRRRRSVRVARGQERRRPLRRCVDAPRLAGHHDARRRLPRGERRGVRL